MRLQGLSSGTVQVEGPQELRPGYCGGLVLSPTGVVGLGTANSTGQGAPLLPLAGHLPPRRVPLATGTRGPLRGADPERGARRLGLRAKPLLSRGAWQQGLKRPQRAGPCGTGKSAG